VAIELAAAHGTASLVIPTNEGWAFASNEKEPACSRAPDGSSTLEAARAAPQALHRNGDGLRRLGSRVVPRLR
jgi:hypothetical protein